MSSLAQLVNPKGGARSDGPGSHSQVADFLVFLEAYRVTLSRTADSCHIVEGACTRPHLSKMVTDR
jgi:hypothetical protein